MPDVASVPANANATGWLYQPFASGARAGVAAETPGAVLSIFGVAVADVEPPLKVTVQVCEDVPSVVTSSASSQPVTRRHASLLVTTQ